MKGVRKLVESLLIIIKTHYSMTLNVEMSGKNIIKLEKNPKGGVIHAPWMRRVPGLDLKNRTIAGAMNCACQGTKDFWNWGFAACTTDVRTRWTKPKSLSVMLERDDGQKIWGSNPASRAAVA